MKHRLLAAIPTVIAIVALAVGLLALRSVAGTDTPQPAHATSIVHTQKAVDQLNLVDKFASTVQPLVVICQITPCANGQEFEIFDGYGSPICSVGEYGGLGCFDDNISVVGAGRITYVNGHPVFWPSTVLSYASPARYLRDHPGTIQAERCMVPARWDAPGGTWKCVAGLWVLRWQL